MKKTLLCTLNAKFIHSSLALRYLKASCEEANLKNVFLREFTINELTPQIMAEIYLEKPDILCFSCYIWNIQPTLELCRDYKKVAPDTIIILGGPEVSYNSSELLTEYDFIDLIVRGEGEFTLRELLVNLNLNKPLDNIPGINYRREGQVTENPDSALIKDLDSIPSPYSAEDMNELHNRTIYFETSRGCPFNCSYCLSSTIKGVRFFSLERVKKDLKLLIDNQVKIIKFVDRTFNCNEKRAREIMQFLVDYRGKTTFHFEICAELLSDDMLEFMATIPPGLFDFEIGVQSTNELALKSVNRTYDWEKLTNNINKLRAYNNIHLHLDLIAGLPEENYNEFSKSFNDVYNLAPDVLQLGFLKLLKGSGIRNQIEKYGYKFQHTPPYQILSNNFISYAEIIKLTYIEDLLDKYFNKENMKKTLNYITTIIYNGDVFKFYAEFSNYWQEGNLFKIGHKKEELYSLLKCFIGVKYPERSNIVNDLLKFDYLQKYRAYELPAGIKRYNPKNTNDLIYTLLKNDQFFENYLKDIFANKPVRQIRKYINIEFFRFNPATNQQLDNLLPIVFVYDPVKNTALKTITTKFICSK